MTGRASAQLPWLGRAAYPARMPNPARVSARRTFPAVVLMLLIGLVALVLLWPDAQPTPVTRAAGATPAGAAGRGRARRAGHRAGLGIGPQEHQRDQPDQPDQQHEHDRREGPTRGDARGVRHTGRVRRAARPRELRRRAPGHVVAGG